MGNLIISFACYANDNDAFFPEVWARESLALLEENMVVANLVHRDFENEVAQFGDTVNTRRVGTAVTHRKTDSDSITLQNANATNVQVLLNMHEHNAFTIKDGEASKSFKNLVEEYLVPHAQSMARRIDRMCIGQAQRFSTNAAGKLGNVSSSTMSTYMLEANERMNRNLAYTNGRNLVLCPAAQTLVLSTNLFVKANERGDGGTALEEARMGRLYGFDTFMDQCTPSIATTGTTVDSGAGAINYGDGYAAGHAAAMTVLISGYEVDPGEFVIVAGDDQLTWATASTASTDTTSVTLNQALKYAVSNANVVTVYKKCAVDGDYVTGHTKYVALDGYTSTKVPQVGQLIAFANTAETRHTYTIVEAYENPSNASQTLVYLDRALEANVSDGAAAYPGPTGSINLAFHKNAIALVSRPLALPMADNVRAGVANYNGIGMRLCMQYDITTQGTIVVMDLLCGIQVLDTNLGCVLLT